MEPAFLERIPALLDLSTVDEASRSAVWASSAPSIFPGLSVDVQPAAPIGNIRRIEMGDATLWLIRSSPALVTYLPLGTPEEEPNFSLMLQMEGSTGVTQRQRRCRVSAGDICMLDERFPFRLEGDHGCELLFLRMPRRTVLNRNPHLEHQTAMLMPSRDAGVSLLADTLSSAILTVPFMREHQRQAALLAIIHLLGAADTTDGEALSASNWRVQAALAFIELNFAVQGLSADQVAQAQRISRRRLDQLMNASAGASVTGCIWNRRLQQSALDLRDPAWASRTASQIAFANGFGDPAHFARAFKRRYGCSPSRWRALAFARPN